MKTKQSSDLWELLCDEYAVELGGPYVIEKLIELSGEDYVKQVFAEDYEEYTAAKAECWDEEKIAPFWVLASEKPKKKKKKKKKLVLKIVLERKD